MKHKSYFPLAVLALLKKLTCNFLLLSILFSSCTGYKNVIEVPKKEKLSIQDIQDLKPGDKLSVVRKGGGWNYGKLAYIDYASLSIQTSNKTIHVNLKDIKRIKYQESVFKTVGNVVSGSLGVVGIAWIIVLTTFLNGNDNISPGVSI